MIDISAYSSDGQLHQPFADPIEGEDVLGVDLGGSLNPLPWNFESGSFSATLSGTDGVFRDGEAL